MKALGFLVVIGLSLAAAPSGALADGRHGHVRGDFHGSRRGDFHGSRRFDGRHHGFNHHRFNRFPAFFSPSVVVIPPVYDSPYVAPAPLYAAPPPLYAPAPAYAAPAPPPVPRVVEFPTGRYELRGDGVYSPYSWVWIPNPPVAPPPPPAPTAPPPPPTAPPASVPEPGPRRVPAQTALYRWTDERGVTTWTDSLEKVPVRYRENARALTP